MATSWRSDQTSTLNLIASYVPYTAPVYNIKFTLKKKNHIRTESSNCKNSKNELTHTHTQSAGNKLKLLPRREFHWKQNIVPKL